MDVGSPVAESGGVLHEYRRFVQSELDARGWKQADLMRRSKLSRQHISGILSDDRDHLGQMPDDATLEKLADGFGVPVERVRRAAARSLIGYEDDGGVIITDLTDVSTDALVQELRRRIPPEPRKRRGPQPDPNAPMI